MEIRLSGDIVAGQLEESYIQLAQALMLAEPVQLNLSQVRRLDTAGFQLLLSLVKSLRSRGTGWGFQEVPERIFQAAKMLDLDQALGMEARCAF